MLDQTNSQKSTQDYLVLARKYRPQNFDQLVGQDALVQTLRNAIQTNKIHHAYVLTGIRGTGKTTTARIMAMALNCTNGPAVEWDENDPAVQSIAEGRHVDVLEFDAASHRKAEEISELFEGVAYAPVEGRYKVYIIDEVHMLSKHAFNAILKTLEEPPERVKFIFATTEANKIPVTVLSRCQRFDLKRISVEDLTQHFSKLLEKEGVNFEESALMSIARSADGSVRDGLSLLDQAIALSGKEGITQDIVRTMLGQSDAVRVYELAESIFSGNAEKAIEICDHLYAYGQDAQMVVTDLLHLCHLLTRLKIVPDLKNSHTLTEEERTRAVPMADKIALPNLSRAYQMLSQAAEDVYRAARPFEALSMAVVRMTYMATLPPVEQLMKQLQQGSTNTSTSVQESSAVKKQDETKQAVVTVDVSSDQETPPWDNNSVSSSVGDSKKAEGLSEKPQKIIVSDWKDIVDALTKHSVALGASVSQQVRPLDVSPPKLVLHIGKGLRDAKDISRDVRVALTELTGDNWIVDTDQDVPQSIETHAETVERERVEEMAELKADNPDVKAILQAFPDSEMVDLKE